jgi:hypothetical protein
LTFSLGASGGPWTVNDGKNVDSVNSFISGDPNHSRWIFGPSFDQKIGDLIKGKK